MNIKKTAYVAVITALLCSAQASAEGSVIKCFVTLSNDAQVIYEVTTEKKVNRLDKYQGTLLGRKIYHQKSYPDQTIISVIECRYSHQSFVNVNAIKLDEDRD